MTCSLHPRPFLPPHPGIFLASPNSPFFSSSLLVPQSQQAVASGPFHPSNVPLQCIGRALSLPISNCQQKCPLLIAEHPFSSSAYLCFLCFFLYFIQYMVQLVYLPPLQKWRLHDSENLACFVRCCILSSPEHCFT